MIAGTILEHLGDRIFKVHIPEPEARPEGSPRPYDIKIAHDYVEITDNACSYYMKENEEGNYPIESDSASNHLVSKASIQISIRDFIKGVLPLLEGHKYFRPEHLIREGENGPEANYTYCAFIMSYTNEAGEITRNV